MENEDEIMDAEKYKYINLDFSATQLKNWDC
jgi:hypothetical protein